MEQTFATTAEQRIEQARHEAVRTAIRTLVLGTEDRISVTTALLHSSVLYQARLTGCGV